MVSLRSHVEHRIAPAFAAAGVPTELAGVTVSNRPDLGQFQANGALAASRRLKTNPRQIAQTVVAGLEGDDWFAQVSIAGPGFVNLTVSDARLAAHVDNLRNDERLGVERRPGTVTVLDYGGPNIAKPMHVGHLRASIIGDSLRRICRFVGHRAISDVHMGDWGLPMGMLISEIGLRQPDLPYFENGARGPFPGNSPVSLEDLERLYPQAAAACKEPGRLALARAATADLQEGRPGYRALWQHFMDVSMAAMARDFAALGVHFDLWKGEAVVHDLIPDMVATLEETGLAEHSEGALIVRLAEPDDDTELPPLILLKSDGAVMYGTTDLATIVDRRQSIDPDLTLYVVDQRQHLHFEQVFRAARRSGLAGKAALEHIGFGTMNGKDGKPFKTRTGGVMKLQDLLRMAIEAADKRLADAHLAEDYPARERAGIARQVGLAAIKFADLSTYRLSNYIFDLDRFVSFEGKTGPYLLYAAVRIKSLLRKAAERGFAPGPILPADDVGRSLMLALSRLPDVVDQAYGRRAPNDLCDLGFSLAQEFSGFYAACHILSETDQAVRASRLSLAETTLAEISLIADLLGLEIPERM